MKINRPRESGFDLEANWFELFLIATSSRVAAIAIVDYLRSVFSREKPDSRDDAEARVERIEITVNQRVIVVDNRESLTSELESTIRAELTEDDEGE
ncbi:hypothetical protein RSSM_02552 [Rhodopirellula sallentina SM41]|uniref:Uncharacterized protein n=1 Tax=Rhodopirellula sallentina SM41 TaxID=1263870 RepID=M5U3I2_9BACT|nr:hypothetical protein RSSM_02552 [Rhodopirellula sallentina SM41]